MTAVISTLISSGRSPLNAAIDQRPPRQLCTQSQVGCTGLSMPVPLLTMSLTLCCHATHQVACITTLVTVRCPQARMQRQRVPHVLGTQHAWLHSTTGEASSNPALWHGMLTNKPCSEALQDAHRADLGTNNEAVVHPPLPEGEDNPVH
jgi:hypothetical protein